MCCKVNKYALLLFFWIVNGGCEKTEHYYLSQEIKDWGYFTEGSYWVYKNINNGSIDSIYVTNTREYIDSNEADKRITRTNEAIDINYYSSNHIKATVTLYSYTVNSLIANQNDELNSIRSNFLFFRINPNNEVLGNDSGYSIIEKLDTFIIEGITYTEVLHITTNVENQYYMPQNSFNYSTHEYWISKHNWIVKMKLSNRLVSYELELVRSKIKQ